MERCKAIILDLDDTLYPEREFVVSGFHAAARWLASSFDIPPEVCADGLIALFDSGIRRRTFDTWLEQVNLPADLSAGLLRVYRSHAPTIMPYADVIPFLEDCRRRKVRLGLLTDGYRDVQQRKIEALNISNWFVSIVLSDSFGRACWKPSPVPFLAGLSQLGASVRDCVYIGDNPEKDFVGARGVGLRCVRVRRPDGMYREIEPAGPDAAPDAEVHSLSEVVRALSVSRWD